MTHLNKIKRKNKRGNVFDITFWLVLGLFFIIILAAFGYIFTKMYQVFSEVEVPENAINFSLDSAVNITMKPLYDAVGTLQIIGMMFFFGLMIGILVTSYLAPRVSAIWFIPYIFCLAFLVLFSMTISNAYETIMTAGEYGDILEGWSGLSWIMLNLPIFVTIIGIVGGILLYSNIDKGEGGLIGIG